MKINKQVIIDFLVNRPFVSNILTLVASTSTAQIIAVLSAPILTRIYSPFEYGAVAMGMSIATVLSIIANGRYELAIMLPEKEEDAINVCGLSVAIALGFFLVSATIIMLFGDIINDLFGKQLPAIWLYVVSPVILLNGVSQALNYWMTRHKRYKNLAVSRMGGALITTVMNIGLGLMGYGILGLLSACIIGPFCANVCLVRNVWLNDKEIMRSVSIKEMMSQAVKYKDFPQKSSIGAFMNTLSNETPNFLIGSMFGVAILGAYVLTLRIVKTPMAFIGSSIAEVLFQKFTIAERNGQLFALVSRTTKLLSILIIPPMVLLAIFSTNVFPFIFGEKWTMVGEIVRIMALFYAIRFVFSIQSTIIIIKRKLGFEIRYNMVFFATQVSALLAGYYCFQSYFVSFLLMSIAGTILYIYLIFAVFGIAKEELTPCQP
ncbi:MAG TPA: oligosaccharide flippase family protein [Patescibacteria group bacterium]|nr:oligosaccharide flippase family protein [Patescibacteria group bacterium]